MNAKSSENTNVWAEQLGERAIELRKNWLSLTPEDEALIAEIDDLLASNIDPLIDDMYAHFLSFPETRAFFQDAETLERAQKAQKRYFLRLTKGHYDRDYVAERLTVGDTHYRIGLDPTWYLGAYNRILTWMRKLVSQRYGDQPDRFLKYVSALTRIVFFDMGLAIEAYSLAKERAIREKQAAIARLEAEGQVAKNILENAPIGIARLDRQLNYLECNAEFLEMLDRPRDAVANNSVESVTPFIDVAPIKELIETGNPFRKAAEKLDLSADGSQPAHYFDWAAWPVKDDAGNVSNVLMVFTDATTRVLLQEQREDFVATLTHDLKTPILAANRAIKLLMEGDFGELKDNQKQILETIHQSNDALYTMVQTLLDVYKYDSGVKKLSFAPHDLNKLVTKKVDELRPLAQSRKLTVSADLPAESRLVNCDFEEIARVIQNLIDNALKFTPAGGNITIAMTQSGDVTRFAVKDTGRGISETDKPKLFQRFWAPASSGRYYASTGLGLYLCRKIVESHGGRIWCDSTLGKGSTFYFTIDSAETSRRTSDETACDE
jgi:signal transduction histidine kinase